MKKIFLLACMIVVSTSVHVYGVSNPVMSRVYGNQFVSQIAQTRTAGGVGELDSTFSNTNSYISPAYGNRVQAVETLTDGTFLAVTSDGSTNSWLVKYTAEGIAYQNFATAGVLPLSGYTTVPYITIDTQERVILAGNDDNTVSHYPWIARITSSGEIDATFTFSDGASWSPSGEINQIGQQTTGQLVAVGFNGTHAMIARYNLDGTLDTTFGTVNGYTLLDGSTHTVTYPTSIVALYSLVIDASNRIYITYVDATPSVYVLRLTKDGAIDTTWNSGNPLNLSYLNGTSMVSAQLRMVIDQAGDLIVAVPSGVNPKIKVASVATSTATTPGSFANTTLSGGSFGGSSTNYRLGNILASSDGSVYFVGANTSSIQMMVARYTAAGVLDTVFNGTGVNFFNIGSPDTSALLYDGAIAQTGEIYVGGMQNNSSSVTSYVSRLYNTQYVRAVNQYPSAQEEGILDQSFGNTVFETYSGVTCTYDGIYASSMKQNAVAALEVTSGVVTKGDILVGLNGLTSTKYKFGAKTGLSHMMFAYLTKEGAFDTSAGYNGVVTLQNLTNSNEYMTDMLADSAGNVYVSGYTTYGTGQAILRIYSVKTAGNPTIAIAENGSGYQGVGISLQKARALLCVAESSTVGHISSYIAGTLDTTFGDSGSGYIHPTSYGLHMGPCYGLAIDSAYAIYAAYVNSATSQVDVVKFLSNGSGLNSSFNTTGVISNIFNGYTVTPSNIRITLDNAGHVIVAATTTTNLLVACIDASSGALVGRFNSGNIFAQDLPSTTSLHLTRVIGVSDGSILLTFWDDASDDTMYMARVTSSGILDTTFNSQGYQQGILPIKIGDKVANYNARVATTSLVQSTAGSNQGNIVVVGYESVTSADATPMVMRVFGTPGTTEVVDYQVNTDLTGTLDTTYNFSTSPVLVNGLGAVVYAYPATSSQAGKILVAINGASNSYLYRLTKSTMSVDTSFGTSGYYATSDNTNITSVNQDASGNILLTGVDSSPWARVISASGTLVGKMSFSGLSNITGVYKMYQQKSGRYILAAYGTDTTLTSVGILVAFKNRFVGGATTFAVDPTFNPLGINNIAAGQYSLGSTGGFYDLAINANDTIVGAYANTASPKKAVIAVITANGSGNSNTTFNVDSSGAPLVTTISADSSAVVQVDIDSSSNILVGASYNNGGTSQVQVARYSSAGVLDTGFGTAGVATITNFGTSGFVLKNLLATTGGNIVLTGYNSTGGHGPLFASRLGSTGVLDTTWNTIATYPDTLGILTYGAFSSININSSAIGNDGTIISLGSTTSSASTSNAILSLVYGTNLEVQVAQNPLQAPAGTKDSTIAGNVAGALPLANLPVGGSVPGVPVRMYIYNSSLPTQTVNNSPNGAMLLASTSGATVYLTQLNSDLSLNSSNFGTNGVVTLTPNSSMSPTSATITDMYVANGPNDTSMPIYVTGYTTASGVDTSFAVKIASNGSSSTYVSPVLTLTKTGCIRQSSNGRTLISGTNGSTGTIVAYVNTLNALDTAFGNQNNTSPYYGTGYYATGVNSIITAMTCDSSDRIYIAYNNGSNAIAVQRLLENGTAVDSTFGAIFRTATNTYSASQIRMALDLTNSQLVVAAQDGTSAGNSIQVQRFNISNGGSAGTASVTLSGAVINLADLFIDNNKDIYVAGYISSGTGAGNSVVTRIASPTSLTLVLDTTYATVASPQGVANVAEGAMTVVTCAALHQDRRVYIAGSDNATNGYMARLYGDYYWTQNTQAILKAAVGNVDITLAPPSAAGMDLSSAISAWSGLSGYTAYGIVENQNGDGSAYIAFGNGTNLILGKVNADIKPVTTFGGNNNGLTTAFAMATVSAITQDVSGNVLVCGATSTPAQKVLLFNSSGELQASFTPTSGWRTGSCIGQQKSGRYIVGSSTSSSGLITAYLNSSAIVNPGSSGTLAVDQTFGPAGSNGFYSTGINAVIDDLCIDSNDYIYYVYRNGSVPYIAKLTPQGLLSNSFNTPVAQKWTTNPQPLSATTTTNAVRIAINSAGNILVGYTNSSTCFTHIVNSATGNVASAVTKNFGALLTLGRLIGSGATSGFFTGTEFYGAMYTGSGNAASAFAVKNDGTFDTSFGISGAVNLTGVTPSTTNGVNGISVQNDGKIVVVGCSSNATPTPILFRAYGYPYIAQFNQAPEQTSPGILDTTLWPSTGAFLLNATANTTFNTALSGYSIARVYEYGNGNMIFVANPPALASTGVIIFRLLKDLTLDTSFNGTGYKQLASSYKNATGLYVDVSQNIYVLGNTNTPQSWALGFSVNGTQIFNGAQKFDTGCQILSQANGRVITAGNIGTIGYLAGATITGAIDVTFGSTTGKIALGSNGTMTDMTIDDHDNIIAVSNNSGSVVLQKVNPAGTVVTDLTSQGTAISTATIGSNVKTIVDPSGNIVVAAQTNTGFIVRSYINNNSGSGAVTGSNNAPTALSIAVGSSGSAVLTNMYAIYGAEAKIFVVGYDSLSGNVVIARIISSGTGSTGAGILTLDTSFNSSGTTPGVLITSLGSMDQCNDSIIHADNRYMLVGSNSLSAAPLMGRVFGDNYATYEPKAPIGLAGTLDIGFGSTTPVNGYYDLTSLSATFNAGQGKAILSLTDGGYYVVVDNGTNSFVARTLGDGTLDQAFNPSAITYQAGIAQSAARTGTNFMMMDGQSQLLLAGTDGSGGWIQRYQTGNSGLIDTTFGVSGVISIGSGTTANSIVEQTLGRVVVAGSNASGGALFGYQLVAPNGTPGSIDTTFNSAGTSISTGGTTPGVFLVNSTNPVCNVIADQYDRLIFAVLNTAGTGIDLYRLTPSGEYDVTFGTNGKISNVITTSGSSGSGNDATSIRVAFDSVGNIVVAGYSYTSGTGTGNIKIVAYTNGTSTTTGGNGTVFSNVCTIPNLVGIGNKTVSLTDIVTTSDNKLVVLGNQIGSSSSASSVWIARLANTSSGGTYALDTTFNPNAVSSTGVSGAGVAGIFAYSNNSVGTSTPYHVYNECTVNAQGTLGLVGYENNGGTFVPAIVQLFDNPYVQERLQTQITQAVGTNDTTFGVAGSNTNQAPVTNGITFFAVNDTGAANYGQVPRAVALYDANNIVTAVDGGTSNGGASKIFITMFDNDGILNQSFNSTGQATVLSSYQNQYVHDMVTFTTASGVRKAILAGYVQNTTLNTTNSLLLQYILTPGASGLDTAGFGGYQGSPAGIAFGDGKQLFSVGQQSTGRIIATGLSQDSNGLLLGYTSSGKLDNSFGNNGYQFLNTGTTGIYTHVVDTQNRIVCAYKDANNNVAVCRFVQDGSGLDTDFGSGGAVSTQILAVTSNSNMKLALNSSNQVYAVSVTNNGTGSSGNQLSLVQYTSTGEAIAAVNNISASSLGGSDSSSYTLARLLVDVAEAVTVVAYDSTSTPNKILIARFTVSGGVFTLDSSFNTVGYIVYAVGSGNSQIVTDALIHPDGRVIIVGSEV